MKRNISSAGQTRRNSENLSLLNTLAGIVVQHLENKNPMKRAHQGGVVLQTMRDRPDLLKLKGALETMHLAQTMIKGTDWEDILYDSEDKRKEAERIRKEHGIESLEGDE